MRILVLSSTPWADDNSFGNSFSSIFGGIPGLEFANVYCLHGSPNNALVERYLQITEGLLVANLRDSSVPAARLLGSVGDGAGPTLVAQGADARKADDLSAEQQRVFDFLRSRRWQIFFWARDLIWMFGRWKSPELRAFIQDFAPDLIFQPIYYSNYMSDIALFIHECAAVPMVGYVSDDVYTLRQFSLSPLYWIDRLLKRRKVRRVVDECEYLYVISSIQQEEYERCFKKRCKVLMKCADFAHAPAPTSRTQPPGVPDHPIQLVYTGNIGGGRWKSLALIAKALEEINASRTKAQLVVYTSTPVTRAMGRALDVSGTSKIMGGVSADRVARLQQDADVLVHVEGFGLADRLAVHQSFSTKIVDYLARARCILAVGPRDVASIEYLLANDAGLVACGVDEVSERLRSLIADPMLLKEYGRKAWDCGRRNHDRRSVQGRLHSDLCVVSSAHGEPT